MRTDDFNELIDSYIHGGVTECVKHFLCRTQPKRNPAKEEYWEPRYLYGHNQYEMFCGMYNRLGGKAEHIEIEEILDDCGKLYCWEIRRK